MALCFTSIAVTCFYIHSTADKLTDPSGPWLNLGHLRLHVPTLKVTLPITMALMTCGFAIYSVYLLKNTPPVPVVVPLQEVIIVPTPLRQG